MWNDLCIGYMRVSVEDGDMTDDLKRESNSIRNQKDLISSYLIERPLLEANHYVELVDDGFSGTNFNRPQMQTLLKWVKKGLVKCIIVKDISRFGRDYIEVGDYLEQIFPFMKVRFISINDHYDSFEYKGVTSGIDIAFRSLTYSMYSKDLSIKTLCSRDMRIQKGYYTGPTPLFGYEFASDNKRTLKIDPEASQYVKRIFSLALISGGTGEIARILNRERIPTPAEYKSHRYGRRNPDNTVSFWEPVKVRRILQNLTYTGTVVNRSHKVVAVGSRRYKRVPDEERSYSPNQHEPIISLSEYHEAQKVFRNAGNQRYKKHYINQDNLFSGYLYCADCKKALVFSRSKQFGFYYCKRSRVDPQATCFCEKLYQEKIEIAIMQCINTYIELLHPQADVQIKSISVLEKSRKAMRNRINKAKMKKQKLYENYCFSTITKEDFTRQNNHIMCQLRDYQDKLAKIEEQIKGVSISSNEPRIVEKLSKQVLEVMISKIWVYDKSRIKIEWKANHF